MTGQLPRRRNRAPISRTEGEARLVQATIDLAREQPFGELSAREIARRADMNHGYVHVWFGSKAGLIAAACDRQAEALRSAANATTLTIAAVQDPEVALMFRLLARLQTEPGGPELARDRRRPMIEVLTAYYENSVGFAADDARIAAEYSVATAAGIATVGTVLRLDLPALIRIWPQVIAALAAARDSDGGARTVAPTPGA